MLLKQKNIYLIKPAAKAMDSSEKKSLVNVLENRFYRRMILWTAVAVYTAVLPYALIIYDALVALFSKETANMIPFGITFILAAWYICFCLKTKKRINFSGFIGKSVA